MPASSQISSRGVLGAPHLPVAPRPHIIGPDWVRDSALARICTASFSGEKERGNIIVKPRRRSWESMEWQQIAEQHEGILFLVMLYRKGERGVQEVVYITPFCPGGVDVRPRRDSGERVSVSWRSKCPVLYTMDTYGVVAQAMNPRNRL